MITFIGYKDVDGSCGPVHSSLAAPTIVWCSQSDISRN